MVDYCNSKGTEAESLYDLNLSTKGGPADLCTQLDVENEAMIVRGIHQSFPTHAIIGEESSSSNGTIPAVSSETNTWIIDPIDGTTNFASGIPLTCVSIAMCDASTRRPVLGVIYAPMTGELYMAIKGCGSFRNGQRISSVPKLPVPLEQAVVCCEFGYSRDTESITKMVQAVQRILQHGCRAIRQVGSGCLDLCYVATGRLDVVYSGVASEGWKPWDYAAGLVICEEAGCIMESLDKSTAAESPNFDLYSKSVICAKSRALLEQCRNIVTNQH